MTQIFFIGSFMFQGVSRVPIRPTISFIDLPSKYLFQPAFQATRGVELIKSIKVVGFEDSYNVNTLNKIAKEVATIRYLFMQIKLQTYFAIKFTEQLKSQIKIKLSFCYSKMAQKQQKQSAKSPNKNNNAKQGKKTDKKASNSRPTAQELQQIQNQKVKEFFSMSLHKINPKIDISPVDQSIVANIMHGQIKIPQEQKNLASFIKYPEEQTAIKITPEQMQIYQKEARRIQHLKLLANLNKQLSNKQPQQNIPYILTKDQHERKIRQFIEEKRSRQKKMEDIRKTQRGKIQKEQKQAEQKAKQLKIQEKQKKRIEIEEKITKQKQQHIHFLSSDIKHRKDLEEVLAKVPLHIKMEENFKVSVELPQLEQKKLQYKQLRQFKQRYSQDQIRQHEKEFMKKSREKLSQSKASRINSLTTIHQHLVKLPQKPERLKSILAEQIHQTKKKWSQRELYAEQKQKRQENYLKKLREEYKPKIDKEKQQQMEKRLIKQKEHLAKVGLDIDKRKVGLQYLSEVKKIAKKKIQEFKKTKNSDGVTLSHRYRSQTLLPSMKRSSSEYNPLDRSRTTDFILKSRQTRLSKIINSEEEPEQKLKMLQIQTEKIEQVKRQKLGFLKHNFDEIASKQASNVALNSIKAKMNLIQLMKRH